MDDGSVLQESTQLRKEKKQCTAYYDKLAQACQVTDPHGMKLIKKEMKRVLQRYKFLIKAELLEKYKQKEPNLFSQYDGFDVQNSADDIMRPDSEGHWVAHTAMNFELMNGADVRVLINPMTPRETVFALLDKIRNRIEKENEGVDLLLKDAGYC